MAKLMKWLLGIVVSLVLLAGLAIAAITLWIDPNSFKPEIEAAAKKQGVILALGGDLAWQFFPGLGLVINQVSVATIAEPANPLAVIRRAALSVQLLPLLQGRVAVDGINIEEADIKLHVNSEGIANWSALTAADKAAGPDDPVAATNKMAIEIDELAITGSRISYQDDQARQTMALTEFSLQGTDIALDSTPFALATSGKFSMTDETQQQQSGQFDVKAGVVLDEEVTTVTLKDAVISMTLNSTAQQQTIAMTVQMSAQLPAEKQPLLIRTLAISNGDISLVDNATHNTTHVTQLALDAQAISMDKLMSIRALAISGADISMVDKATGKTTTATKLSMNAQAITLDNKPFPLSMKAGIAITQPETPALQASMDFAGQVAVDESKTHITLTDSKLVTTVSGGKNKETLNIGFPRMAVTTEPFAYQGSFSMAQFNARRFLSALGTVLPEMQSPTALTRLILTADVQGADNAVRLDNMQMQMDETAFSGSVAITDMEKNILDVKLKGDQINADNYLAPATETAAQPAAAVDENPEIIPVETLRGLAMDVDITFGKMMIKQLPLTQFAASVAAHDGLVKIKHFDARLYDKPMHILATIDARNAMPAIEFDVTGTDLPVGELLRDFGIEEHVSGYSDMKAVGNTTGIRKQELMKGLNAKVEMTGKQFRVSNINIEQTVCEFIAKAEQRTPLTQAWETFTQMREMSTRITIRKGVAVFESLSAGVEKIALTSTGKLDLVDGKFDMHLTTRITDAITKGGPSCEVRNQKWLNRDIPVRCKGSFDDIGIKTCLPDMSVLEDIAKDAAREKLKEETDIAKARADAEVEQAKAKANAEVEKALKKKLGDDSGKAAKDLLKGLLKK